MNKSPKLTLVYVVTSDGKDIFADMVLLSILSVRVSNPGVPIVALCDMKSAHALRRAKHRLLELCDQVISGDTPEGPSTFRNRWIKTQLPKYVQGPALYLDADTLVRRPLSDLMENVQTFGGVTNHHGLTMSEQIWEEDFRELEEMGWPLEFSCYFNGGVFFWRNNRDVDGFYDRWHGLWLRSAKKLGRLRDQPALNTALLQSGLQVQVLPDEYNWQVMFRPIDAPEARQLHLLS